MLEGSERNAIEGLGHFPPSFPNQMRGLGGTITSIFNSPTDVQLFILMFTVQNIFVDEAVQGMGY